MNKAGHGRDECVLRRARVSVAVSLTAAISGMVLLVSALACLLIGQYHEYAVHRSGAEAPHVVLQELSQRETRDALLAAVTVSGLTGLVVAVVAGVTVARRALDPVARLLDRRCRFVEDASHELRAPLTRLHVRSQLLLQRTDELPEPLVSELRRLVADSRELGEVLDDMLRGARLRSDAPGGERVDLAEVAADLLGAEAGRLDERDLVAVLETRAEPLVVLGVKSALRRMLSALVDNAIGHTPPRGRITVSVAAVDGGRTVELVVEDTGVGFDPAQHRILFNRFVRGGGGRGHRFGMGLALARDVVESHGGTVDAAGRPGEGARFTVRLPAAPLRPL